MATLTVHEFLSRLVAAEHARSADSRCLPDGSGLGDTGNTDVLQAASPTMHHVSAAETPTRTVGADRGLLGGTNTHAAVKCPGPFALNGHYTMEFDLATADIFSQLGDVDELLRPSTGHYEANVSSEGSLEADQARTTASSETGATGLVGNVDQTVSGAVGGTGVTDVVDNVSGIAGGVTNTVAGLETGAVTGRLGEVTSNVPDVATSVADLGAVSNELPVDASTTAKGLVETVDTAAPVADVESTVGGVAGDVVSDLGL